MKFILRSLSIGPCAMVALAFSAAAQTKQEEYDVQTNARLSAGISAMLVNPWSADALAITVMTAARDGVSPNLNKAVKGRVFHSPLGHNLGALEAQGARSLYLRGSLWAAGVER